MTEQSFVQRRAYSWDTFSGLITGKQNNIKADAPSFIRRFRELTQDLNIARAHGFDPAIVERLNMLVNEGNQILYGQHAFSLKQPARFILRTFPQKVRFHWRGIGAAFLLFYGIAFFFAMLCIRFPEMAKELIAESQLDNIREMYDPQSESFLSPRNAADDADMFGYYIYNNISIAFRTFAGGIFAGIGSLFLLCANALYLGVAAGHIINAGFGKTFFTFIVAHSAFELTAINFSAYAGLLLGYRFFVTRGLSRGTSIKEAGEEALPIIAGSTLMLVIAAVIEAFWSSRHQLPLQLRIGSGAAVWILLLLYFVLAGKTATIRRSKSLDRPAGGTA
jgi:uncharacterized membrane protein SpoIIM required for sporulation